MSIGVVPKFSSHEALKIAQMILEYAEKHGVDAYIDKRAKNLVDWEKDFSLGRDRVDVIIVVGGDGTVLNTLHMLGDDTTPVATIRYGRRGFLCDVPPFEYATLVDRLVEGRYKIVDYMRLVAEYRGTKLPYVLNEYAVVTSGEARAKVARLYVKKDDEEIFYLVGDGVVVAPPIGSTAYSLAAGGPVVEPTMEAIIVSPLAPITFCSRSVVLPPDSEVVIRVSKDSPNLLIVADGSYSVTLQPRDEVVIRKAPVPARFARFYLGDHYVRLFERCM